MIVFTKYDKLSRLKIFELEEEEDSLDSVALAQRGEEEAQKVISGCVGSLKGAMGGMNIPMAPIVNVSSIISYSLFGRCGR